MEKWQVPVKIRELERRVTWLEEDAWRHERIKPLWFDVSEIVGRAKSWLRVEVDEEPLKVLEVFLDRGLTEHETALAIEAWGTTRKM